MNCNEIQRELNLYVAGEIEKDQVNRVENHLSGCSDCTQALKKRQRIDHFVRDALGSISIPSEEPIIHRAKSQARSASLRMLAIAAGIVIVLAGVTTAILSLPKDQKATSVIHEKREIRIISGNIIVNKDRFKNGGNEDGVMKLPDETIVRLAPKGEVDIQASKRMLNLLRGSVVIDVVQKSEQFIVQTPTSQMALSSGKIKVHADTIITGVDKVVSREVVIIEVLSGTVQVKNSIGAVTGVSGETIRVEQDQKPIKLHQEKSFNQQSDEIGKLLNRLDSDDPEIREKATEKLIDLWDRKSIREHLENTIQEAKKKQTPEVEERCNRILVHIDIRLALGRTLVTSLGHEKIMSILSADEEKLLNLFKGWMKDEESRNRFGLDDPKQQSALAIWIVRRLITQEIKHRFIGFLHWNPLDNTKWRRDLRGCVSALLEFLNDQDDNIRGQALFALNSYEAKEHVDIIAKFLKDKSGYVKSQAAAILISLRAEQYAKELFAFIKDSDNYVRRSAIVAIGVFKAKDRAGELIKLLSDEEDMGIKCAILYALGELGEKKYAKHVAPFLNSSEFGLKYASVLALGKLEAPEYIDEVAKLLNDEIPQIRGLAAWALGSLKAKKYTREIAKLLGDKSDETEAMKWKNERGKDVVYPPIVDYVRSSAAWALGQLQAKEYADEISKLLRDSTLCADPSCKAGMTAVNKVAAQALKEMGIEPEKLEK